MARSVGCQRIGRGLSSDRGGRFNAGGRSEGRLRLKSEISEQGTLRQLAAARWRRLAPGIGPNLQQISINWDQ
jgi:hypothetical protein